MVKQLSLDLKKLFFILSCFLYIVLPQSELHASEIKESNTSDNNQLVIASSNNFPPINILDDNGQLTGFGRDLSTAVAKSQGLKVRHIHSGIWPNVLKWLDEGTADLIHDTGFTPERGSYLDFTIPILEMPESIFVKNWQYDIQDIASLQNKKVACVNHHITHIYLQKFKEVQCYLVNTPVEGLLALINGKVDAFIYPEQIVLYLSQQLKLSDKLKVVGEPLRVLTWSMTVKKGNKELLEKLNSGISAVKESGEYKRIYDKWFGKHLFSGYSKKTVFIITLSAVLFSILLVATIGLIFYVRGIKKVTRGLADSEKKYRTLIDKLPMNVFLKDTHSVYLSCNQVYADSLGIKPEEIIEKTDYDFYPENAENYQRGDRLVIESGETHEFEEYYVDHGRKVFINTIKTPVYNDVGELIGVLGLFWDITAEKETRQELLKKEKELREMLESMVNAVFTIDESAKILTFNKAAENLFGYDADQVIGLKMNLLMPESVARDHDDFMKRYDEEHDTEYLRISREVVAQAKNKKTFPIYVSVAELPHEEGEKRRFIASCQDLTQIKQQQEQLRQTQKMDALGKLTGGIAHDFNNLLGIILGYAELLNIKLKDQPTLKKYTHEIQAAGRRGNKLTNKLLNFTSTEMSEAKSIDINELILAEEDMLNKTLTARIKLVFNLDEALWPVWLNVSDLENAILNLCINAMHAIEGSGQITLQTKNIKLNEVVAQQLGLRSGNYILLSVTDTGCGIDDASKEKIFEPFYSTKGDEGTGLGLTQVYGFVERSAGGIKVDSEVDQGTQFSLYFPHYIGEEAQDVSTKENVLNHVGGKETILIVDDEIALLGVLSETLSQNGYTVLSEERAGQALKTIENESVDLIISDVVMPEMDGYQFASIVQEKYPDIKIQMVSGFTDDSHIGIKDKSLHDNLLYKPYQMEQLLKRVRGLLDGE